MLAMAWESERPEPAERLTGLRGHLAELDTEQVVIGLLVVAIVAIGIALMQVR